MMLMAFTFELKMGTEQPHLTHHALIVSSSRYWFNYRHAINALSIYNLLKDNGVSDANIILMVADEYTISPRNVLKNKMYAGARERSLFEDYIQIDYRGEDVTVENAVLALTGRQRHGLPQLNTDAHSQITIYWTGHGGNQFFKFQDVEEIMATDIAAALRQLHADRKYHEVLMMADTCQAFTLGDFITAPNVTIIGSSLKDESSYAHHSDAEIGLASIERYTHGIMEFVKRNGLSQNLQVSLVDPYSFASQGAHIGASDSLATRKLQQVPLSDFFAARPVPSLPTNPWSAPKSNLFVKPQVAFKPDQYEQLSKTEYHGTGSMDHTTRQVRSAVILEPGDPIFVFLAALSIFAAALVIRLQNKMKKTT